MDSFRRSLLATGAALLSTIPAGCLGDGPNDSERQSGAVASIEYEVTAFAATFSVPEWADPNRPSAGHLAAITSADRASDELDFDEVDDDRRDDVDAFVEETDFDSEFLLYVASEGPNSNYREMEITTLDVEDGVVVGRAEIQTIDEKFADEAPMYPSILVRVTPDEGWPAGVELAITDGWDNEKPFEVSL